MDIRLSEQKIIDWAKGNHREIGLNESTITAKYIRNPGGLVNQSYLLSDGITKLHVKLANQRKSHKLKKWVKVSDYLSRHYRAPKLIKEIHEEVIPGFTIGLVFNFLEGNPLSKVDYTRESFQFILETIQRLHHDKDIRSLIDNNNSLTYADAFIEEYISRFDEDLEIIKSNRHLLDFVTDNTLDWFFREVDFLREKVINCSIFSEVASDVVHNDLHWRNILVGQNKDFGIIDWDDISVSGDAAMDYSVLLWPLYETEEWLFWKRQLKFYLDNQVMTRLEWYFRAKLLDDVIDVLADYVDSENIPELKEEIQARNRRIHLDAYAKYVKQYGITK